MNQEDLQKKYLELQLVDQQIKSLQQQLVVLEQQAVELATLAENLEHLKKVKAQTKSFVQIGVGISVEATIADTRDILINVGSNVAVKKTVSEAIEMIKSQIESIGSITQNVDQEIKRFVEHASSLQEEIQKKSQRKSS
ncbi:MAG: prefoldin subunit alpha [Patescibacteria group bacterium]